MIYYTSDWHLGHLKLAQFRGFETVEEHDEMIIANHNEVVRNDDDIVYVAGDITLSSGNLPKVARMRGRRVLVAGNHDAVHPMHRDAWKHMAKWSEYFEGILPYARRIAAGQEFLISHLPYSGDHTDEERGMQYRLRNLGMPIVHGHVHSTQVVTWDRTLIEGQIVDVPQIHIGLDAWLLRPVPEHILVGVIKDTLGPVV